jgi:hypothetical protein
MTGADADAGRWASCPTIRALSVLSNPAPWTIAAMFILMGGLVRTGALDWVTSRAEPGSSTRPKPALGANAGLRRRRLGLRVEHAGGRGGDPGLHPARAHAGAARRRS